MACFCSSLHQPFANMGGRGSCGCDPEGGRRKIINFQELTTLGWHIASLKASIASRIHFLLEKFGGILRYNIYSCLVAKGKQIFVLFHFLPPFLPVETPPHPLGSFVSPLSQECLNHESLDWPFSCLALPISESRVEPVQELPSVYGIFCEILLHVNNKHRAPVLTEVGGQSQ